jgi:hypothetical protein
VISISFLSPDLVLHTGYPDKKNAGLIMAHSEEKTEITAPSFHLTDRDKEILSMTDDQYHLQTWDELKQIICT